MKISEVSHETLAFRFSDQFIGSSSRHSFIIMTIHIHDESTVSTFLWAKNNEINTNHATELSLEFLYIMVDYFL